MPSYQVDLIGERGRQLRTFHRLGATYVLGLRGRRYAIRVSNPTPRRVEAVVSVDGLDVIDGKAASFGKRGYVIPAYGSVRVDGFRVSQHQVAAFRFSSIRNSYAARTGHVARIGVIRVAIFDEAQPVMIRPYPRRRYYRHRGRPTYRNGTATNRAPRRYRPRPRPFPRHRPGLGTRYGEHRNSSVRYTSFTRRFTWRPSFVKVLRYNNRAGLVSLGILAPTGLRIAR